MNSVGKLVRRGAHAFRRRYLAHAVILTYHRVAEDPVDPWGLCVSPANFTRQMELLRKLGCKTVHVSALADALRDRRLSRATIAVTFDDGYVDNLEAARPILDRYQTPATHYATAGYIGSAEPFWWDVLDLVFLRTKRLPETLEITLAGERISWELGAEAVLDQGPERAWPAWKPLSDPPTRRHELHDTLWRLLVTAMPAERQRVVRELAEWAGVTPDAWKQMRPMSEDELRTLHGDGLVEIGAHSLTHPALSALPPPMQAHELRASKSRLEDILGARVRGFAYPHGRASPGLQQLAREAGYDFACGSMKHAVQSDSNPFELPRVSVKNWDEKRFEALLREHVAA